MPLRLGALGFVGLMALAATLLMGCDGGQSSGASGAATVQLNATVDGAGAADSAHLSEYIAHSRTMTAAATPLSAPPPTPYPPDVPTTAATVVLTVTGPSVGLIQTQVPFGQPAVELTVPFGPSRTFSLQYLDAFGETLAFGTVTQDIFLPVEVVDIVIHEGLNGVATAVDLRGQQVALAGSKLQDALTGPQVVVTNNSGETVRINQAGIRFRDTVTLADLTANFSVVSPPPADVLNGTTARLTVGVMATGAPGTYRLDAIIYGVGLTTNTRFGQFISLTVPPATLQVLAAPNVTTFAGNPMASTQAGTATTPATNVLLKAPRGLAQNIAGDVIICESGTTATNAQVDVVLPGSNPTITKVSATLVTGGGYTFASPQSASFDSTGALYIADQGGSTVPSRILYGMFNSATASYSASTSVLVTSMPEVVVDPFPVPQQVIVADGGSQTITVYKLGLMTPTLLLSGVVAHGLAVDSLALTFFDSNTSTVMRLLRKVTNGAAFVPPAVMLTAPNGSPTDEGIPAIEAFVASSVGIAADSAGANLFVGVSSGIGAAVRQISTGNTSAIIPAGTILSLFAPLPATTLGGVLLETSSNKLLFANTSGGVVQSLGYATATPLLRSSDAATRR